MDWDDVELMRSGSPGALRRLFDRHADMVLRICKDEDVAQMVWIKVWNSPPSHRAGGPPFRNWLARVAKNTTRDQLRSATVACAGLNKLAGHGQTPPNWESPPDGDTDLAATVTILELCLSGISPQYRLPLEVLLRRCLKGEDTSNEAVCREVIEHEGRALTAGALAVRLHRGRTILGGLLSSLSFARVLQLEALLARSFPPCSATITLPNQRQPHFPSHSDRQGQ